jgi:hypothetical protein
VRRVTLSTLIIAMTLIMASAVAMAANRIYCPNSSGGLCYGTKKSDTMNGSPTGPDYMYARGDADIMRGNEGADIMEGEGGEDTLYGGKGDDTLWGGGGPASNPKDGAGDKVYGGKGDDHIYSGFAKGGVDKVFGGAGNDIVEAQQDYGYPLTMDVVDCGKGANDTVYLDRRRLRDRAKNCEEKVFSTRTTVTEARRSSGLEAGAPDTQAGPQLMGE